MRLIAWAVFIAVAVLSVPLAARAEDQKNCPVSGKPVDKEFYADHEGKRVYFCCPNCKAPFEKDAAGYIRKMEAEGVTLAKAEDSMEQTACPISGMTVDKKVYADHEGKRVYFCCEEHKAEFRKDPDKYLKKLEEQGVELEKSPEK